MIIRDKVFKTPEWGKKEINRWADYIEFLCLYSSDHILSKDDLLDILTEENSEKLSKGEERHSYEFDRLNEVAGNFYDMIRYRKKVNSDDYPFEVEGDCILLPESLSVRHLHYIFLLSCSNVCFIDGTVLQKVTDMFERYCRPVMRTLMPAGAQTELFGTSRETPLFHGSLRNRITQLADLLGAQTTKIMDNDEKYDRIHAGDGGLDLVSFLKLDEASHIPFAFGQCTCSYEKWVDKQSSLDTQFWRSRISPLAPFWEFMFVPFYCRDGLGSLENLTEIHTCLMDRQRILAVLGAHRELFQEYAQMDLENLLREFWNETICFAC